MKQVLMYVSIVLLISISAFAAVKYKPHVYPNVCVGCGECVFICPIKGAIEMVRGKAVINAEKCNGCERCIYVCSYGAVW